MAERTAELRELARTQAERYRAARGTSADIVTLGRSRGRFRGLTEDYLDVYFSAEENVQPAARFEASVSWQHGELVVSGVEAFA